MFLKEVKAAFFIIKNTVKPGNILWNVITFFSHSSLKCLILIGRALGEPPYPAGPQKLYIIVFFFGMVRNVIKVLTLAMWTHTQTKIMDEQAKWSWKK